YNPILNPVRQGFSPAPEHDLRGEGTSMKKTTKKTIKKTDARGMTRREFVGGAVAAAAVFGKAPALLRGQNLNNKLDIAFIAAGGRANASMSELTIRPDAPPG